MPEWIKKCEDWKQKMAEGKCGGMMGEMMKKFMDPKFAEMMKAKFCPQQQSEQTEQKEESKSEEQPKTFNPMEMMN